MGVAAAGVAGVVAARVGLEGEEALAAVVLGVAAAGLGALPGEVVSPGAEGRD